MSINTEGRKMLRAFSDRRYDYYELTQPLGLKNLDVG